MKQKECVDQLFAQLEELEGSNPRWYMDHIRSMWKVSFDKESPDDTSHIDPSSWYKHFSDLLSKKTEVDPIIETYINENKDMFESELGTPFSKEELLVALKDLKK